MLLVTALVGTSMWALIETRKTEQFKAAAERLQQEIERLESVIKMQQQIVEDLQKSMRRKPMPVKGSVPDHWLERTD
jgi:hypothetical protein